MKKLILPLIPFVFAAAVLNTATSYAEKMSSGTQDLVIDKMERALSVIEKNDAAYIPSQKRWADLLAERARTRFMAEIEVNCAGCKGSAEDRKKAIITYEQILDRVEINEHGPVLFQLGHLYEMSGNQNKAIELYERILKDAKPKKITKEIISRSHVALGDLLFQKNKFKDAHFHFKLALRDKDLENRALVIYNMSWCDFNTGKLNSAIETIENLLRQPELLNDASFHADVMRDLATFYSRRSISNKEIALYVALSPENSKKELTLHFATEADRIGQKNAARTILDRYLQFPDITQAERLDAFVRLAQINYDRGQTEQSNKDFSVAAATFRDSNCDDEKKCAELQKTMKRYVTELHRSKKLKPDSSLLTAYVIYANTFPQDRDMTLRAAQLAQDLKQHKMSTELYRTISGNRHFSDAQRTEALQNEVSAAEASGDAKLKQAAYVHYLQINRDGAKSFEIRYQMAYLKYQNKNFNEAASDFDSLARDSKGPAGLRKKSADLALDSLSMLKADEKIETTAADYAVILPASRTEFQAISRKAILNRAAVVANDKKSSSAEQRKSLVKMIQTDISKASASEKILFYTNQSILAEQLGEDQVYIKSLQLLIGTKELSQEKRSQFNEQLIGYYEKHLDFKSAYVAAKTMKSRLSTQESEFRLSTLADLGNLNTAAGHYRKALAAGLKGQRALVVRSRLVLLSSNPTKELNRQFKELKKDRELLNETTLFVISKNNSSRGLENILASRELKNGPAAHWVNRQKFYSEVAKFKIQLQRHQLDTKNDRRLSNSIAARMKLIEKADGLLGRALKSKDIGSQVVTLDLIYQENDRFVRNLAGLPLPRGLTAAEQQQYLGILKAKSKPFFVKAKTAQKQLQEIWANSPALAQAIQDYRMARTEIRKLLVADLSVMSRASGDGKLKNTLNATLEDSSFSNKDLLKARQSVAQNPNNIKDIENLKILETKGGHPLMATYLEARLSHIQRGEQL